MADSSESSLIPSNRSIGSSIYGAWRLANRDPNGLHYFELTAAGFYQSFFAAALLVPCHILLVLIQFNGFPGDWGKLWFAEALIYALDWIAYPILMIWLCRLLNLSENYAVYIIAYNWAKVMIMALWLPLTLVTGIGLVNHAIAQALSLAGFIAVLYYLWFITRTALQAPMQTAVGLVIVESLTSALLQFGIVRIVDSLF